MIKVFVDIDDTLTAFSEAVTALGHADGLEDTASTEAKKNMFLAIIHAGLNFWTDMQWKQGGRELWEFLKPWKPVLLSSPGKGGKFTDFAETGKKIWVQANMPGTTLFLTPDKFMYAERNALLIDDKKHNIGGWEAAGGVGVLWEDPVAGLEEVKRLLRAPNLHKEYLDVAREKARAVVQDYLTDSTRDEPSEEDTSLLSALA